MRSPSHRFVPRLEVLEDRLALNSRFVVPLEVAADNVTTFHSLSRALSTAGLASGDVVTIEQFSTPGAISNANVDAINAPNVTIRGAADFGAFELPVIRTADAISLDAQEAGLAFQNVNLLIQHTLTSNANATIRGSLVTVGATGGDGIRFNGTTAAVLENNTIVNTGLVGGSNALIAMNPGANSNNRITANSIISTAGTDAFQLAYNGSSTITDVVSYNTFLASNNLESPGGPVLILVNSGINGLTIRNNTFRDATAENAAIALNSCDNIRVLDNVFDLTYDAATPTDAAIFLNASSGNGVSATVKGNIFSTGVNGRAIELRVNDATVFDVKIEGNDFLATPLGVLITATAATAQLGDIDLGGGPLGGLGGNNFRAFRTAATLTSGAIVVDGGATNLSTATINSRFNLFGVANPETVIRDTADDNSEANVIATGNLTGNAAFVQALYVKFLRRVGNVANPNDAGLWVNLLDAGTSSGVVAFNIIRSPEALGYVVDDLYRRILGRPADAIGRNHHINLLASGVTIEQVQIGLLSGAEYRLRFAGDSAYVATLFQTLLGRSPTQGDINVWLNLLPSLGRAGVAAGFVFSTEYRNREVTKLFFDVLKRTQASAPSPADVAFQVNTGLDILSLRVAFAGSAEFFLVG